ncbi:MAG: formate dehydrogenase accessory sulfurtransferase FdhD [Nitrososphaerota archaeon]|jgi:FdhD protein|nr:formate dehydrogenase accessory sulfurtransferase FdhD [Nitrososphaerota archaeon]
MRQVDIVRVDLSLCSVIKKCDLVAEEVPFNIVLNNVYSFVIWCSPSQFRELAVGYLFAEEILYSIDEIENISISEKENICHIQFKASINLVSRMGNRRQNTRIVPLIKKSTSSYQHDNKITSINSNVTVKAQTIFDALKQLNKQAKGFRETGGLHNSGIFKADGTMVAFSEDVGRHNTVDKVIGKGMLTQIDFAQCFILITGRIPGDMIYKTAKAGLPIVASVTAVLNSGITSAQKANTTLAGFVRNNHLNIYTHPQRIILQPVVLMENNVKMKN